MKASTLFGIAASILVGLGVVGAARYNGLFDSTPPPPPPPTSAPPKVLVAGRNLFEGLVIQSHDVRVRPLRPDELERYKANRKQYLPPVTTAAVLRVLTTPVEADQPILREHLESLTLPQGPSGQLAKGMQAVNVAIPKERAVGGLIRKGDLVDVLLTVQVFTGSEDEVGKTLTAPIARNIRILFKRNLLWSAMLPVPEDRPVHFTLEANPYRATLITLAQTKGDLTLVPSSLKDEPDEIDHQMMRDDLAKVILLKKGELTVGDEDLERIFGLKPVYIPTPKPPVKKDGPVAVELYSGINFKGHAVFHKNNNSISRTNGGVGTMPESAPAPTPASVPATTPTPPAAPVSPATRTVQGEPGSRIPYRFGSPHRKSTTTVRASRR